MLSIAQSVSHRALRTILRRLGIPICITYDDGTYESIGEGDPVVQVTVRDWRRIVPMLMRPDPAVGEAYMDGAIDIEPIEPFIEALENIRLPGWMTWMRRHWPHAATPVRRQYRDIQAHYDRGNAFFSLWLDESRTYSCAYFRAENENLERAQAAKVDLVLKKAHLQPGQRLLDIGCGWGEMIVRSAVRHQVSSFGITLSRQQWDHARQRIHHEGLEGRVRVALMDYRELSKEKQNFDRVVSVGMLEHVGRKNLPVFFRSLKRLLRPGGVGVVHCITRAREQEVGPWVRRYIFPGAYIPSWRQVVHLLAENNFRLTDVESLRRHYALTLERWANRFENHLPHIRALGFDEPFIRMWRLYLRGGIAQFRTGQLDLHQFVFTHGCSDEPPLIRENLYRRAAIRMPGHPNDSLL